MSSQVPKQRFIELAVHEVSLVDRPANEREFLVIKSLSGGDQMSTPKNSEANAAPIPTLDAAVIKSIEEGHAILTSMVQKAKTDGKKPELDDTMKSKLKEMGAKLKEMMGEEGDEEEKKKAKKREFSDEEKAKLKKAQDMIAEASGMVDSIIGGPEAAGAPKPTREYPAVSDLAKAIEDAVTKATKPLHERMEKMEEEAKKAPVSKGLSEGGADGKGGDKPTDEQIRSTPVNKAAPTGTWSGIL